MVEFVLIVFIKLAVAAMFEFAFELALPLALPANCWPSAWAAAVAEAAAEQAAAAAAAEEEEEPPPEELELLKPTLVCMAEMDNILLIIRLFLPPFLASGAGKGPSLAVPCRLSSGRRALEACGAACPTLAKQAAELASEGSARMVANKRDCLAPPEVAPPLSWWCRREEEEEVGPPPPLLNSWEAVIWRWNKRGPEGGQPAGLNAAWWLCAGLWPEANNADWAPLAPPLPPPAAAPTPVDWRELSAFVLSCRWNIELVVYLDCTGGHCCCCWLLLDDGSDAIVAQLVNYMGQVGEKETERQVVGWAEGKGEEKAGEAAASGEPIWSQRGKKRIEIE